VGKKALFLIAALIAAANAQTKHLAVERIALHQVEDGPILANTYEFIPGETAYFSCRLTGYQAAKKDDDLVVKLSWEMRMLDPAGVPIEKDKSGRIEDVILPQDKNWMPKFLANFTVPSYAPGGTYHVPVKIKDEVGGTEVSAEVTFKVRGHEVQPSDTLVARNFMFLRGEDDRAGMREAVYHPGTMLWARFDITGFKYGDKNRFAVDYGLAVLRESGEKLFEQPIAAEDSKESFYPQRYVPGMLSLTLDQNVAKGSYILVVTVRDKVGNQTFEVRQPFQVS
jgi:hypothetical protein